MERMFRIMNGDAELIGGSEIGEYELIVDEGKIYFNVTDTQVTVRADEDIVLKIGGEPVANGHVLTDGDFLEINDETVLVSLVGFGPEANVDPTIVLPLLNLAHMTIPPTTPDEPAADSAVDEEKDMNDDILNDDEVDEEGGNTPEPAAQTETTINPTETAEVEVEDEFVAETGDGGNGDKPESPAQAEVEEEDILDDIEVDEEGGNTPESPAQTETTINPTETAEVEEEVEEAINPNAERLAQAKADAEAKAERQAEREAEAELLRKLAKSRDEYTAEAERVRDEAWRDVIAPNTGGGDDGLRPAPTPVVATPTPARWPWVMAAALILLFTLLGTLCFLSLYNAINDIDIAGGLPETAAVPMAADAILVGTDGNADGAKILDTDGDRSNGLEGLATVFTQDGTRYTYRFAEVDIDPQGYLIDQAGNRLSVKACNVSVQQRWVDPDSSCGSVRRNYGPDEG